MLQSDSIGTRSLSWSALLRGFELVERAEPIRAEQTRGCGRRVPNWVIPEPPFASGLFTRKTVCLAPFAALFHNRPDLLHEPKAATGWAELIRSVVPRETELYERINPNFVVDTLLQLKQGPAPGEVHAIAAVAARPAVRIKRYRSD